LRRAADSVQQEQQVDNAAPVAEDARTREAEERRLRRLRRMFPLLLVVVFLVYAFTTNLIPTASMKPTLNPGDQILTMRAWLAYTGGRTPSRGDIVIFNLPPEQARILDYGEGTEEQGGRKPIGVFRNPPGEILIKRVVGLPGESIQVKRGRAFVNGKPLIESYKTIPPEDGIDDDYVYGGAKPLVLGRDELFVMGDNRSLSEDSRYFGAVKIKHIRGKFVARLFHRKVENRYEEARKEAAEAYQPIRPLRKRNNEIGR
jgi:signal peptidase I